MTVAAQSWFHINFIVKNSFVLHHFNSFNQFDHKEKMHCYIIDDFCKRDNGKIFHFILLPIWIVKLIMAKLKLEIREYF
jgi:hypothetical protein